jgi:two-component system cell cycle response regulator DivK
MPNRSDWTVLIVDDEPDNIEVVKLVMEFYDMTVLTAASARECLTLLENSSPTVLLVDIQMPDISGIQLLEMIREHAEWRALPIIAMTAYSMEGDRERMMRAGFDGYIGKPINAMTLVDDVGAILDARGR